MHKICQNLKLLIFFLNFDLSKRKGASGPLAPWLHPWAESMEMSTLKRGKNFVRSECTNYTCEPKERVR